MLIFLEKIIDNVEPWSFKLFNKIYYFLLKRKISSNTFRQFLKHYLVGGLGVILNYVLFSILLMFHYSIFITNLVVYTILVIFGFFMQKNFTYKDRRISILQPVLYIILAVCYSSLDTLIINILRERFLIQPFIGKLMSIVLLTPISFISQKFVIFRGQWIIYSFKTGILLWFIIKHWCLHFACGYWHLDCMCWFGVYLGPVNRWNIYLFYFYLCQCWFMVSDLYG